MISVSDGPNKYEIDKYADECPYCHHAVLPIFKCLTLNGNPEKHGTSMEIAFQCSSYDCARLFIGIYRRAWSQGDKMIREFRHIETVPVKIELPKFNDEVSSMSNMFVKVYSQAFEAESYGLDEISGVGYRKALEYLIKDYCIIKNSISADTIKKLFLGKVIEEYVDDENIKNCSKRASWIGNDETHYVKKWEDKDIKDLKILIQLTVNWISNKLLTEKYLLEMGEDIK